MAIWGLITLSSTAVYATQPEICSGNLDSRAYAKAYKNGKDYVSRTEKRLGASDAALKEYETQLATDASDLVEEYLERSTIAYCAVAGVVDSIIVESHADPGWKAKMARMVAGRLQEHDRGDFKKYLAPSIYSAHFADSQAVGRVESRTETQSETASLTVTTVNGALEVIVDENANQVSIESISGDTTVDRKDGKIRISEKPGRLSRAAKIKVILPPQSELHFESAGGSLSISGTPAKLKASTASGNIRIRLVALQNGASEIGTTSGNVLVEVPRGGQLTGQVQSLSGSVKGKNLLADNAPYRIKVGTVSGDIEIKAY